MIYKDVQADSKPDAVRIYEEDTDRTVMLAKDIHKEKDDDSGRTYYVYDEAVFKMPDGRKDDAKAIEAHLSEWWQYAEAEDADAVTLEDRVAAIEDAIMDLMGGMLDV